MIYLTKILLNAEVCHHHRIRDDYALHRFVYSLFPEERKSDNPRILYADKGVERGIRRLYVLSGIIPETGNSIEMTTVTVSDRFLECEQYCFETLLNPVHRDSRTRKLIPITGQLALLQWFIAKSASWGFRPDEERLEVFIRNTKSFHKNEADCVFNTVLFKGILTVTDRQLFKKTFINGLGRAKSFGFGLLQLSPVTTDKR